GGHFFVGFSHPGILAEAVPSNDASQSADQVLSSQGVKWCDGLHYNHWCKTRLSLQAFAITLMSQPENVNTIQFQSESSAKPDLRVHFWG
ncbi:MAG: hypothetical protein WED11_09975, partial [Natronospirillum sp.]